MALDATPKGAGSNSYVTEADATAYLTSERLYVTSWSSATTATREAALIWATFLLDQAFEWDGAKTTAEQALRFPRSGLVDPDGYSIDFDTIPTLLVKGTATLALRLLERDRLSDPSLVGLGLTEASLGVISVKVSDSQVQDLIPKDVALLLAPLGRLKGGGASSSFYRIERA